MTKATDKSRFEQLPPEMQERLIQIMSNAELLGEVQPQDQANTENEKPKTIEEEVHALRKEVAEMREELRELVQVANASGQAVGQLYAAVLMQSEKT